MSDTSIYRGHRIDVLPDGAEHGVYVDMHHIMWTKTLDLGYTAARRWIDDAHNQMNTQRARTAAMIGRPVAGGLRLIDGGNA